MFKQFIDTINGDEIYMLCSLFIFFAFFIAATVVLITMKKSHIKHMENIPLDVDSYNS